MKYLLAVVTFCLLPLFCNTSWSQSRLEKVLSDHESITANGFWLYNNLEAGKQAAKKQGKPIIVTFRCIPCEECVKLDEALIEADREIQDLLSNYIRVRQVSNNGLDMNTFQFDYDQSFNVMLMNADGTVYGRFGTRSDRTEWEGDVSIRGLAEALRKGLQIHRRYPNNQEELAGKQGEKALFPTPNESPLHQGKFPEKLVFNDQVVKNCIHCHMVGDAQRDYFVRQGQPIPDKYLFQYPHPKIFGLIVDPETCGTLKNVTEGSLAEKSGFQTGDEILSINQQPVVSIADMQWVFQNAESSDTLNFQVKRDDKTESLSLPLEEGWRSQGDISWRVTSWPLRAMVFGGMVLKPIEDPELKQQMSGRKLALQVTHVGQYGKHATAKNAGIQKGDIVIQFAGRNDLPRETDLLAFGVQNFKVGDSIEIVALRDGQEKRFTIPFQE